MVQGDGEAAVKRALAVCTELWRRQIWRDARTVNVIASATAHESTSVMLAALKFFLGQDLAAAEEDDEPDGEENTPAAPTKDDVYRAYHKVCWCYDARLLAFLHVHTKHNPVLGAIRLGGAMGLGVEWLGDCREATRCQSPGACSDSELTSPGDAGHSAPSKSRAPLA